MPLENGAFLNKKGHWGTKTFFTDDQTAPQGTVFVPLIFFIAGSLYTFQGTYKVNVVGELYL